MKISYSWLKDYIDIDLSPDKIAEILTQTGLEVGSVEEVEMVKGGLKGLVVGKVLTCESHPNADKLSKTTVDIGTSEVLPIVCGAPNVAAGQKVIVATVGTKLYMGEEDFIIKKAKIRGEVSQGMICAEDEIGLGTNHDGIMVLDKDTPVGLPAKDYFNVQSDWAIEIDLTPNRIDGASHIGVARDLAAFLNLTEQKEYKKPSIEQFKTDNHNLEIPVEVANPEACPRYSAVTISDVQVKESPDWLKNRLKTIGQTPINNVVDITNYVLHETGQPLHAFDADEIKGGKVVVKKLSSGTRFTTLDEMERELHHEDLMICDSNGGMCIGGVFGGVESGVKASTTNIFLESACFDPVHIRKTARRHGLNTDASFRFERGVDPNGTIYALKRAALLIKELAGGTISSDITDVYPEPVEDFKVYASYANITRLIGKEIEKNTIKKIVQSLEIKIENEDKRGLSLLVPPYRVDVKRESDVIEEILRIYGYNNVEIPLVVKSSMQFAEKPDPDYIRNLVAETLTALGFNEIWSNSLTKSSYYQNLKKFSDNKTVKLLNPLSADLNGMRQTLLFGGLECIGYNSNRQNRNLKLYEFGNCYFYKETQLKEHPETNYREEEHLGLFITGQKEAESWTGEQQEVSFFQLKSYAENILSRLGFSIQTLNLHSSENELFTEGITYKLNDSILLETGIVKNKLLDKFEIENPVYYADFNWGQVHYELKNNKITFKELPKFPSVRRDLALLVERSVKFQDIKDLAFRIERKLLKKVDLFDVYEGKGISPDKKSYAVSFILRDDKQTLRDKQIDKTMQKFVDAYKRELDAELR